MDKYELLDSGDLQKLEQFGPVRLIRPCPFAIWSRTSPLWNDIGAAFTRDNRWEKNRPNLQSWHLSHGDIKFRMALGDSGNVGLFPEHESHWEWIQESIKKGLAAKKEKVMVLNMFGYTGGATLSSAQAGALVCHVDASKTAVAWARENAALNQMQDAPIRWIVDDALEFAEREVRRNRKYDGIILDPPTFGRGPSGQLFKIEEKLPQLIEVCQKLLTDDPLFFLLTCHTPGWNHLVLHHIMSQRFQDWKGNLETGEMTLGTTYPLPAGSFARWKNEHF